MDFFIGKQIVKDLILPPGGLLIIALVGLGLWHFTRLRRTGTALCALGLASLWLLAMPIIADVLERAAEGYPALDLEHVPRAGAIVILAGGMRRHAPEYRGTAPLLPTLQRLSYGARVARATGLPVLVSGNGEEATIMRDFLQLDFGIEAKWVESHSQDTHENAQLSALILKQAGIDTIVLVTSAGHMLRAAAEFHAAGLAVVAAPTGMWTEQELDLRRWVPNADALWRSRNALYEFLGNVVLALHAPQ